MAQALYCACHSTALSRPLLPDHAELAALKDDQRQASRARCSRTPASRQAAPSFDRRTHRRHSLKDAAFVSPAGGGCGGDDAPQPPPTCLLFSIASRHRPPCRDDAALADEQAFDAHLLEQRLLREVEEAERIVSEAAPMVPCPTPPAPPLGRRRCPSPDTAAEFLRAQVSTRDAMLAECIRGFSARLHAEIVRNRTGRRRSGRAAVHGG